MTKTEILWLPDVEDHDYPAASSYLSLLFPQDIVAETEHGLRMADISHFKAKDILRASGLPLLGIGNSHVAKDRKKIDDGKALSPILLVRRESESVIVADGYHRVCAVYSINEDAVIPCKIV